MVIATRIIAICIVLAVLSCEVSAQHQAEFKKNLSIGFGATHYRFIDEGFSHHRTQYNGTAFSMNLGYQTCTPVYFFNVDVQGSRGDIVAVNQKLKGSINYVQLAASYARHARDYQIKGIPSAFYIGGQLRSANYVIEDLENLEEASATFAQTLDLFLFQRMSISEKHSLEMAVAFPVAGFLKRARYDGGANQDLEGAYQDDLLSAIFSNGKFMLINPFSMPQFDLGYVHHLTRRTDVSFKYEFNYFRNNFDRPINLFSNSLVAGVRFKF